MTNNGKGYLQEPEDEPTDLLDKISLASALEQSGQTAAARALYQEVVSADPSGIFGASAQKAIEALDAETTEQPAEMHTPPSQLQRTYKVRRSLLQWFYNLPISRKQLIVLILSEVISLGLVGISAAVIVLGLRLQLSHQAESELAVTQLAYNIKVNQMALGFRGQSDNPAVIAAAKGPLTPQLRAQVRAALINEVNARQIEYATLVGQDLRIIVNANNDRQGEIFDPNGLVTRVLQKPEQIKQTEIVTWAELQKEDPPLPQGFANQDALIRYTLTPVKDPATQRVAGVLVSGDIVNNKLPIAENTISTFAGGYSAIYLRKPTGEFVLSTSLEKGQAEVPFGVPLPDTSLLVQAVKANGQPVTNRIKLGSNVYTMAAKALPNSAGEPTAILVRGTPEAVLNKLLFQSLWLQLCLAVVAIGLNILLAMLLGRVIAEPIKQLGVTAEKFSQGERTVKADVFATDEVGQLATTFNEMADNINHSEAQLLEQAQQRQAEADFQRQEKERLQRGVINLLLDIEEAKLGDLTVRAKVDAGEMGAVADAFNTTIESLCQLVTQVKTAANHFQESALTSESSVGKLAREATTQADMITDTLDSVAEMDRSIQSVVASAQEAANIAHQALVAAQDGGQSLDQTISSIQNIHTRSAETLKKVNRLAESSQEISKIVTIISSISEKTNLLAFNASIEAARAGQHGYGFRVVADEVRRLAERVTTSTKEIEELVTSLQLQTTEVLKTMEQSTTHAVTGTQLVANTKQTLQNLAMISQKIDQLLQSISASTISQAQASKMVNQTMQEVAAIAKNTSSESEAISSTLKDLVIVAQQLQNSMSKFRVEK